MYAYIVCLDDMSGPNLGSNSTCVFCGEDGCSTRAMAYDYARSLNQMYTPGKHGGGYKVTHVEIQEVNNSYQENTA